MLAAMASPVDEPRTLPDEILEEIFLRLPTPAALARASTASASFCRVIAQRSFLRRFRKVHPPPLLGFAGVSSPPINYVRLFGKTHVLPDITHFFPVYPSAPLARALADAADFTYSFLPEPGNGKAHWWTPGDVRDGRVLLEETSFDGFPPSGFFNLAVCDPLSRRYVLFPPVPEDITTLQDGLYHIGHKLVPIAEDEDETSFKLICTAHYETKLILLVFSSVTGQWCVAASVSWSSLGAVKPPWRSFSCSNYVGGCLYWAGLWRDKVLVLDTRRMELSTINILNDYQTDRPGPGHNNWLSTIVEGTKGALEMLTLVKDGNPPTSFYLYHTIQQNNNGEPSGEWNLKRIIALPRGYFYSIDDAAEGFLFLRGFRDPEDEDEDAPYRDDEKDLFSVEIKTSEVKMLCRATEYLSRAQYLYSYYGFPPSLSKPSL